ncbi:Neoverrucotoxin subunit alpha [Oryzias melastigma]|uniref:Neoverrucotoxin subunit alpha n=1 Tax=Oryzias melastigma TaxID=30732 RepID=A0A834F6T6_ORYME|nr:Neoverrucotoxin subunit alpha [Oryzias melastigma]
MMELKKAADSIRDAAWEACDDFEQQCAEHIRWYTQYLDGKCMEMRETVGQLEKAGLDWTWSRRGQLERDVNRLKGVQHKLSQLSQTDDPIQFFQMFFFAVVLKIPGKAAPKSLKKRDLCLVQGFCATGASEKPSYWEVSWDGGVVEVAVSYIGIQRKGSGSQCCFGHNKLSWKLICSPSGCTFWHNKLHRSGIPAAACNRVGVHLEYMEGRLSFYSILDPKTMVLLHQTQTIFTEPLYPGFSVDLGAKLKICNLKAPSKS